MWIEEAGKILYRFAFGTEKEVLRLRLELQNREMEVPWVGLNDDLKNKNKNYLQDDNFLN